MTALLILDSSGNTEQDADRGLKHLSQIAGEDLVAALAKSSVEGRVAGGGAAGLGSWRRQYID